MRISYLSLDTSSSSKYAGIYLRKVGADYLILLLYLGRIDLQQRIAGVNTNWRNFSATTAQDTWYDLQLELDGDTLTV